MTEFLDRGYYEHRPEEQPLMGYRNGYREKAFKTDEGTVRAPPSRARDAADPYRLHGA
ncbi:MAG: hypothetical protein JRC92_04580 [Deltaproteobacteria bacterium]|nr:hypothetical protein [Deltaproteobacteria bacterium]